VLPPPGPGRARRVAWVAAGVAATTLAGYLVAALVLDPAPLLPNERAVPRVMGTSADDAARTLQRRGLRSEIADHERNPVVPAGLVAWQDPPPGVAVPRGSAVALTVSDGPPRLAVPDVRGLDADLAQQMLRAAGIEVDRVDTVASPLPTLVAVATTPAATESVTAGSRVVLHLARGAP
jgi:beta-lactam-binding protein with PASTA domain